MLQFLRFSVVASEKMHFVHAWKGSVRMPTGRKPNYLVASRHGVLLVTWYQRECWLHSETPWQKRPLRLFKGGQVVHERILSMPVIMQPAVKTRILKRLQWLRVKRKRCERFDVYRPRTFDKVSKRNNTLNHVHSRDHDEADNEEHESQVTEEMADWDAD